MENGFNQEECNEKPTVEKNFNKKHLIKNSSSKGWNDLDASEVEMKNEIPTSYNMLAYYVHFVCLLLKNILNNLIRVLVV